MKNLEKYIMRKFMLQKFSARGAVVLFLWFSSGCDERLQLESYALQVADEPEVNVLMFQDSVENDHQMIQMAVDYAKDNQIYNVFVPDGEYQINTVGSVGQRGIVIRDSIRLRLGDNAILKAIPNSSGNYSIITINNVSNVSIYGGKLFGDRYDHTGTSGEWGMGIEIRGGENIDIKKVSIKDCWGDGIYIAGASEQILIDSVVSDNNRRQGMSVVHCDGLIIKNSYFINTNGKAPQSGIDLEPNVNESVENVEILNCYFENNSALGLHMYGRFGPVINVLVKDTFMDGNPVGLSMRYEGVNNVEIENVNISNSTSQGLRIFDGARDITMEGVQIFNSTANAITVTAATNVIVEDFLAEDFMTGVVIGTSKNINFSNGEMIAGNTTGTGLSVDGSDTLLFESIDFIGGKDGIRSSGNSHLTVSSSTVSGMQEYGVYMSSTHNSEFLNSVFINNRKTPIYLFNSNSNKFNANEFVDNGYLINNNYFQINVSGGSSNNEISSNNATASTKINKPKYIVRLSPATSNNIGTGNIFEIGSYATAAVMDESGLNLIN